MKLEAGWELLSTYYHGNVVRANNLCYKEYIYRGKNVCIHFNSDSTKKGYKLTASIMYEQELILKVNTEEEALKVIAAKINDFFSVPSLTYIELAEEIRQSAVIIDCLDEYTVAIDETSLAIIIEKFIGARK